MFGLLGKGVYFDQSDGGGSDSSAQTNTENSTGADGEGGKEANTNANAGDGKDKEKQTSKVTFTPEQQEWIEKTLIPERLNRAKFDADKVAEKARKKAEEEALAKNKEFETLAEQRKSKVTELEAQLAELATVKDQAEKYKGAMEKIIKAQVDKLPKTIKVLLEKLDPIEKMEYIAEHAKELNIEVLGVPETDTNDSSKKLNEEADAKAKKSNANMVKGFLSR